MRTLIQSKEYHSGHSGIPVEGPTYFTLFSICYHYNNHIISLYLHDTEEFLHRYKNVYGVKTLMGDEYFYSWCRFHCHFIPIDLTSFITYIHEDNFRDDPDLVKTKHGVNEFYSCEKWFEFDSKKYSQGN